MGDLQIKRWCFAPNQRTPNPNGVVFTTCFALTLLLASQMQSGFYRNSPWNSSALPPYPWYSLLNSPLAFLGCTESYNTWCGAFAACFSLIYFLHLAFLRSFFLLDYCCVALPCHLARCFGFLVVREVCLLFNSHAVHRHKHRQIQRQTHCTKRHIAQKDTLQIHIYIHAYAYSRA